ncbi:transcription factor [Striga asiatica]|uniref:Transcription factor n=1 Tax=Striga asiatica TaxID=4170 RepID=A0A5A7NZD7_STRAF|nr:transcription factor [Striga asiatica]
MASNNKFSSSNNDNNKEMDRHHYQMQHTQITHHHQNNDNNSNNNQIAFGMMQSSSSSTIPGSFNINSDGGAYDLGELDQALFLYLDGQDHPSTQDDKQNTGMRPHTLNIFPSQPMHVEPFAPTTTSKPNSTGVVSPATSGSKRSSEPSNPRKDAATIPEPAKAVKREGNQRGPTSSSEHDGPKTPDPKTLRRLAQNREAARKSRLRKKAYVQQLESSRVRLTQLEQEIQRARSQGFYLGGNAIVAGDQGPSVSMANTSSDAAVFDMEYARWLEEHHRLMVELRNAVNEHLPENELRVFVDNCLAHYDQMISLKCMIAKSDVFHLVSGSWKTPAERCYMWMGDFRPSELIKIILNQVEPLTEQQLIAICGLQQSTHEAEEALTQELDSLNQSISETIASDSLSVAPNMNNYMSQMAIAINKLSTLEGFVRQADNLRHQTLHRLHQILTTRQAARCFLAVAEYFHRLRVLSSLWLARPRQE